MDRLKRIATMFLAVCLIVTTIPTSVFAAAAVDTNQVGKYFDVDKNGNLPAEPTLVGSSENSYEDGKVKVSKTISSTGVENEFEVTLTVKTTEEVQEEVSSADAATVIIIDASNSMSNKDGGQKSRMENARAAAQAFINGFVAENATRKVAIVKFSGYKNNGVSGAVTVTKNEEDGSGWLNASDLATRNNNTIHRTISGIQYDGGTCTEAGLILAKNLLTETLYNDKGEEITNKNVILLTDGKPTYGVTDDEEGSTSKVVISANGSNIEGNGSDVDHRDDKETHKGAEREAAAIKAMEGVTTYAIYVGNQTVDCEVNNCYLKSTTKGVDWLSTYCGFITYEATAADQITARFEQILQLIELKAQAWETTDPMGSHVEFQGVTQTTGAVNQFDYDDGVLNWDIKNGAAATERPLGNGVTEYTYTLKYKITLNNLDGNYEAGEYYAANGKTGVSYVLTETKANGEIDIKNGTAYFDVPSVKGFDSAALSFTKVDSISGNPIEGAEFTLSTAGWSRTVTTGANGLVSFSEIPSGHTYTLSETKVPEGYEKIKDATVKVSYGQIEITGLDIVDGKVVDPNKTTSISGTKTWNDDNNRDGKRPDSIKINLLADGNVKETKTVTAADGWKWTFDNLPTHIDGKAVTYSVTEESVAGYTTNVNGYNVTNSHTPERVKVEGTKTWDDDGNRDGKRPSEITINLLANGTKVDSKVVTAADGWKYSFDNLYKYEAGKEIIYTVTENEVADYQTTYDGLNVVNTHTPQKTAVNGVKVWDDANDQDGKRPDSITVRLYADGEEVDSKTVTEDDNWTWAFTDLLKYKDGGKEIVYTVTEDAVDNYETEVVKGDDGYTITNTHTPEKTSVSGSKTWDDNNDQDGKRPDSITIRLYANGVEVKSKVVTEEDGWEWTFGGLDKYAAGKEIVYTISEDRVAEYETTVNGYNVTNTHEPEVINISGSKTWNDADDQDGLRPKSITINLLADGKEIDSEDAKAKIFGEDWAWEFNNLPKYKDGKEIVYTITEDAVDGYTTEIKGFDVVNTHVPAKTEVSVSKTWDDGNNQDGLRPGSIEVNLLADGKVVDTVELSNANGWAYEFTELDKFDDGKEIVYSVREANVPNGYVVSYDGNNITNKHVPEVTSVEGTKTWDDANNQDGLRPGNITVNLLADGTKVDSKTVTADDGWKYEFNNLPKYKDGIEIEYSVEEDKVPEGYTVKVEGYDITNSHITAEVDVEGTKTWNDANNQDGLRPTSIKVNLLADGKVIETVEVTAADNWSYEFNDLPKFNDGKEITYTVEEDKVPEGYTSKVEGYDITNTHIPETLDVEGSKTWNDKNNQDGVRPESITINLLANGEVVSTKTVTAEDGWKWSFTDLDKFEAGKEITYTITEEAVDNYTTEINGYDVTNSHTTAKVDISGAKTWDDKDDQDGVRPESITINLLANGTKVDSKTVTEKDGWKWTFTEKDKFKDGVEIVYTITEEAVEGYETEVDGFNVTNSHKTATVDINGSKRWVDANDQDGIRPESITINLLADGEQVGTKTVTPDEDGNWAWEFTGLDKYKNKGTLIEYTIEEVEVAGYVATYDGYNVTNTHEVEKTEVSGAKTWNDANDQDGVRPESIVINLFADGEKIDSKTVTAKDGWKWSFTDLDLNRDGGIEIVYTITEDEVADYTTKVNGYDVENTHKVEKTEVSGAKTWNDANDQDGLRPESIVINLFADGEKIDSKTVTAKDGWKWSFTDLDVNRNGGIEIVYTITEDEVADYTTKVNGFDVTNTYEPETVDVEGTKTWEDNKDQDGARPDRITINLLADGKVIDTVEVTEEDGWAWEFNELPKYRDHGTEIVYTITEEAVEGYDTVVNGFNVTNTYEPETVDVEGAKTWKDNRDQDGIRPDSITINLLADGKVIDTVEVTEEDGWAWAFENLPKYRDHGTEIVYTITEEAVEGYDTEVNGFNVTNTYEPETLDVEGTKTWDDADDQDGVRPESITINLLADGEVIETVTVTEEDGWAWEFNELPKYKNHGTEIVYTITEEAVDGYAATINGYDVTNTHTVELVDISGTKTWDDADDQDGIRPGTITINLLADGTKVDSKTVTEADGWAWTFTGMDKYRDHGTEIVYTITEEAVNGYETVVDGFNVTNSHETEKVDIDGTKTWADANDQDGVRPESITINLLADGEVVGTKTVTEADEWAWTFEGMDKYRNHGTEIVYTITEEAVVGYETTVNGYDVTNTHEVEKTEVSGSKTWVDADNQDGIRPDSITINLLADGEVVDTITVTEAEGWAWTFTDLDKYRDHGTEIVYTVNEEAVEGYEATVDGYDVTNTHEVEKTEVSGSKTWDDANNQDGKRPESITINLLADGEVVATKTVTEADEWAWTFTGMDKYRDQGTEIVYTISEEAVAEYTTAIEGFDVTNSYTVEKVDIAGTKTWDDADNQDGARPESITINLLADGEEVATKTVTEADEWAWTFEGMDKYRDGGVEIVYTIVEETVDGYETVVDGYNVTNSRETEKIDIAGTKTWDDMDNLFETRPESITINLLADGEVVATKTVTEADEWAWTFEGMDKYRDQGTEIVYTITEEAVMFYITTVDGYNVTNRLNTEDFEFSTDDENPENLGGDSTPEPPKEEPKEEPEAPKTGDDSNMSLWTAIMALAATGFIGLNFKRKEEDE